MYPELCNDKLELALITSAWPDQESFIAPAERVHFLFNIT